MKKRMTLMLLVVLVLVIAIVIKSKVSKNGLQYSISEVQKYTYVKYQENEKYGIIDRNGNRITEAIYTEIDIPNPEKDIFICNDGTKTVVLNSNKQELFTEYDKVEAIKLKNIASILCFEKSVLRYEKNGLYGLIDFTGKEITKNEYKTIENLQGTEGKFIINKDDKFGILLLNGTKVVDTKFDNIATDGYENHIESGYIVSKKTSEGYRYGYINYEGKELLDTQYNEIVRIQAQKDIYLIASKNGKYGLYKNGKQIIKDEYQSISYTDNGAIIIEKNKQFGIANLNGEIKTDIKYTQIEGRGIYNYAQNSKENDVFDSEGNKIEINFNKTVYETQNEEYRITTLVNNNITYYGIEKKDGTTLIDNTYNFIEYIYKDYFIAEDEDEKYGVINASGKKIIGFDYDLIQTIKNKTIIQASTRGSKNVDFYDANLQKILTMKSAKVENKIDYIKVYNDKETKFYDKEGRILEESSNIIQNELKNELPEKIGEYEKTQESLDDVYYRK